MAPTRIYVKPMLALMAVAGQGHGAHHRRRADRERAARAAGGGQGRHREVGLAAPETFQWLQSEGNVAESEMHRVFNCGIGMVVVVARENAAEALRLLNEAGEKALEIGRIERRLDGEAQTIVV